MVSPLVLTGTEQCLPPGVAVSGLYLVASLEMVLVDSNGSAGIALRIHSYPKDPTREGYWAPPNLQYRVDKDYEAPQTPSALIQHFQVFRRANEGTIARDMALFAESFGLRGVVVEAVSETPAVEVKPSINQPNVTNAFHTLRFTLRSVQEGSEVNLIDREGRHGFVNLSLGTEGQGLPLTAVAAPEETDAAELLYLGKPLISSLQRTLRNPAKLATLRTTAIEVSTLPTVRSETGLVVVADIAGYGRVLTANYLGYLGEPANEQRRYQARVLGALEKALTDTGTTQVQTVGDGFVAAYPVPSGENRLSTRLLGIIANWTLTVQIVHADVNVQLARAGNPERLGSRLAINCGAYEWGRINGLGSFSPAFNGPAVVDTARLEQGLNAYMTSEIASGRLTPDAHLLALTAELATSLREVDSRLGDLGWRRLESTTLRAKERSFEEVNIYAWDERMTPHTLA